MEHLLQLIGLVVGVGFWSIMFLIVTCGMPAALNGMFVYLLRDAFRTISNEFGTTLLIGIVFIGLVSCSSLFLFVGVVWFAFVMTFGTADLVLIPIVAPVPVYIRIFGLVALAGWIMGGWHGWRLAEQR